MAQRQIDIRFKGRELDPGKVRARDIAAILTSLENALQAMAKYSNVSLDENAGLCLMGVQKGSLVMRLQSTSDTNVFHSFDILTQAIRSAPGTFNVQEIDEIKKTFGQFCKQYNCISEFRGKASQKKPDAIITSSILPSEQEKQTIRGTTTVRGIIEKTGGAQPKAWIRLHYGLIPLTVEKKQAIELGALLYKKVLLQGTAVWNVATRNIVEFELQKVVRVCDEESSKEVFDSLVNDFGHYFKDDRLDNGIIESHNHRD